MKAPRTVRHYREHCYTVARVLQEAGYSAYPWEITPETVTWLIGDYERRNMSIAAKKNYIHALRVWTEHYNNYVIRDMKIRWPHDTRPRADWLTHDQAIALLQLPKNPAADLIVHCELCLGMRRVEVMRLKPASFAESYVEILGKGSMGGKIRLMPYHRDTVRVYHRYMTWRREQIATAKTISSTAEAPDDLLIYRQRGNLKTYGEKGSGIDKILERLSDKLGFAFTNHTLRRTFGRTMYRSGVAPATISKMLGHESIDMTLRYIGVDLDDMNAAMEVYSL